MSQLTRGEVGRSDNSKVRETPYIHASMGGRIGSMFQHWTRQCASYTLLPISLRIYAPYRWELGQSTNHLSISCTGPISPERNRGDAGA